MGDKTGYRARFRFRVLKKLNIKDPERTVDIAGRIIRLTARDKKSPICDSEWLVADARGFDTEDDARRFATNLKTAADISSVATRLGIDTGINRATAGFGSWVKEKIRQEHGYSLRDDIHGVDVFPDDPNTLFPYVQGRGSVLVAPDPFLSDLGAYVDLPQQLSKTAADVLLLLNYALMRPEPVAQIVFAVSAVEMIGQKAGWTDQQKELLEWLAQEAGRSSIGADDERRQVAEAIRRDIHKVGLTRGVLNLLEQLGLAGLKGEWRKMYAERSRLVHGLAPEPGADYSALAHQSVGLCGYILLKLIAQEVPAIDRYADRYYKP